MTLENLLNKCIQRGRKPRGKNYGVIDFLGVLVFVDLNDGRLQRKNALDLRKLVSKESGLWQFVCKNEMAKEDKSSIELNIMSEGGVLTDKDYRFWLIESALCDEDKLEQFLLDNIKVE